jgi:hypothetical protein
MKTAVFVRKFEFMSGNLKTLKLGPGTEVFRGFTRSSRQYQDSNLN